MSQRRLVFEMMIAERSMRRWIDARSGDSGIGAAGAGVLFHLAGHDNALVGDVSAAMCASPSGMSGLVSRLEKGGLVAKTPDAADARAVRLSLTPAGRAAVEAAKSVVRELNAEMSDGFTDGELAVVARWLGHITHRLT
ncbi:MarR family winged helix-turn-helix transcriptional regulator [Actinoplanes derwentensis]|uniref:DNA-binding transcriptional regulator, MarR family n=1 Tax=Actinoplanes derwentensis TaxID=113562 RepID=A0A1H2ARB2_9ACTN|nr:MarR family winged helix-turn-helix transcriptional regulator [Actinoplanes derwentensis]GID84371.1 transcriptional regulator [Actinoplanes derwentensis]SDT48464.1 DNA-binding transcriptional regulator, MarR family [Actinoplanes derwentensis]